MLRLMVDENFDHRILRGLESQLPDLDFIVVQYTEFRGVEDPQLLAPRRRTESHPHYSRPEDHS